MSAPDQVRQGANYDFTFTLEGLSLSAFTYLLEAKQFPDDTATISRTVTLNKNNTVPVTITPTETASMAIGLWYLIVKSTDADETIHSEKRIQITKAWL